MKQCPKCQTQWEDSKRFCPYDGTSLLNSPVPAPPAANSEFGATGIMNPAQLPVPHPIPSSTQPVFQASMTPKAFPAPTNSLSQQEVAQIMAPVGPAPTPPPAIAYLRSTDDTPTVKSSHPIAFPSPEESNPASEVKPIIVPVHHEAPQPEPVVSETEMDTVVPPAAAAIQAGGADFVPGAWGGGSPDELTFHLEQSHKASPDELKAIQLAQQQPVPLQSPVPMPMVLESNLADEIPKTMSVFEVAQLARERKRAQSGAYEPGRPRRSHAEYFQLLNERNRIVQQYVELLGKQGFSYTTNYSNKDDHLIYKFNLAFIDDEDSRCFPISVALYRKPNYSVLVSIDLKDIGRDIAERTKRTELMNGKIERTDRGPVFHLDATEDLPNEYLMRWLDENFKQIFQLAYQS